MKILPSINEHLQQLEALSLHPSLKVNPDQHTTIVGNILHHLMYPYFLTRAPEMQEKFSERQYQVFMQALADYCLRGYVENPEPRLTIEFIQGLHRQFYSNALSVPVKAVDGSMTTIVPGEFKTTPVFSRRNGGWAATPAAENVQGDMASLLDRLHDEAVPLFQRYIQTMFDFTETHPFPDGNGKMALVIGDLYLLKLGLHPPYFAKYRWSDKKALYSRAERYATDTSRDISDLYPVVLRLYEECGLGLGDRIQLNENAADV
ncbi:MAG: Fic family protein [Rhodocyclaceae bacterium]|nr:Fic family protein [Rhodocyclaceae bacterium]